MTNVAIIPARAGSKRLPGKNLLKIGGKPLVARAIEAAMEARLVTRVVVSSDDARVLEIARGYRDILSLPRPSTLARDDSPALEYVQHVLQHLGAGGEFPELITIVQPSSPLTIGDDIDNTVRLLTESSADSAVSVMRLDHSTHPAKLKRMDNESKRLLDYLEPERGRFAAAELPEVYVRNCAVYVARRSTVESGMIVGPDCRGHLMPRERSVDINEFVDYMFACFLWEGQGAGKTHGLQQ